MRLPFINSDFFYIEVPFKAALLTFYVRFARVFLFLEIYMMSNSKTRYNRHICCIFQFSKFFSIKFCDSNLFFSNVKNIPPKLDSWIFPNVSNVYSNTLSLIYGIKKQKKKEDSAATATNCITVTGVINTNNLTKHEGPGWLNELGSWIT